MDLDRVSPFPSLNFIARPVGLDHLLQADGMVEEAVGLALHERACLVDGLADSLIHRNHILPVDEMAGDIVRHGPLTNVFHRDLDSV